MLATAAPAARPVIPPPVTLTALPKDQPMRPVQLSRIIVSAVRVLDGYQYVQSDVAVSPGNSGGPLIDQQARVIGLTVSGFVVNKAQQGLNLFIPAGEALDFLYLSPRRLPKPGISLKK